MSVFRIVGALVLGGLVFLGWLIWPIYQFYAHDGAAPMPPFGWTSIESPAPGVSETFDSRYAAAGDRVLEQMEAHRARIGAPSLSAAVAIDGEIVWRGAVGWDDIAKDAPATPATVFRVGSTSKAITATALARMAVRGDIDLDAPIGVYMSELPNPDWAAITPRMLASHMSGIPHYGDNEDAAGRYHTGALRKNFKDMRDAVDLFDESALLFEPGTAFEYSSLGTVLLGAVMSHAANKPYREIIREEVLEPAGMNSTIVAPKGSPGDFATFYYVDGERYRRWRDVDLSHRLPGGGWASTPSDLVRMGSKWLDETYIAPEVREAFWTPQRLSNGEVNEQDYAIGWRWRAWEIDGVGLARNANHGGVSRGSQSWLLVFPDFQMAVAFNTNRKTDEFRDFGGAYAYIVREFVGAARAGDNSGVADRD